MHKTQTLHMRSTPKKNWFEGSGSRHTSPNPLMLRRLGTPHALKGNKQNRDAGWYWQRAVGVNEKSSHETWD